MSLDVYIKSKKKEEDRKWVANITHNMNKMAQKIFVSENKETLYDYVWRPEELGREIDTKEMVKILTKGIYYDLQEKESFEIRTRKRMGGLMIHFLSFLSNTKRRVKIVLVI